MVISRTFALVQRRASLVSRLVRLAMLVELMAGMAVVSLVVLPRPQVRRQGNLPKAPDGQARAAIRLLRQYLRHPRLTPLIILTRRIWTLRQKPTLSYLPEFVETFVLRRIVCTTFFDISLPTPTATHVGERV